MFRQNQQRQRIIEEGQALAEWLNGPASDERSRVVGILEQLRQLERLRQTAPDDTEQLVLAEAKLRHRMRQYRTTPMFLLRPHPFFGRPTKIIVYHTFDFADPTQISEDEAHALRSIEELLSIGLLLSRLKTCQVCAQWVFHKKAGGKCCDRKQCKDYFYERKQERIEQKRINSKKNYHHLKDIEKRNLERVKGKAS
jgi:hypothetical protein